MSPKKCKRSIVDVAKSLASRCCNKGEIPEDLEPEELAYILRKLIAGYTPPEEK